VRSRTSLALFSVVLLLAACSGPVATQLPVIPSLPSRSSEASAAPSTEPTKTPKATDVASAEPTEQTPSEEPTVAPTDEPSTPPQSTEPSLPASALPSPLAVCGPIESLSTKTPGRLTLSTDIPAFPPWWSGDASVQYPNEPAGGDEWSQADFSGDPYSGEGFENATAYAIANAMGFTPDLVDWIPNAVFEQAFAPGPKQFDFHMAQTSIRPKRALAVDFSEPYFDANQAVLALADNPITDVQNINDLKSHPLGAAANTTSFDLVDQVIQPTVEPKVYPDNTAALTALKNGQVDGIVVDLGTAFYMRDAQLAGDPEGKIVGQFSSDLQVDQVGAVLQKNSSLTPCVNQAIQAIKADGTLQAIYDQWIVTGQEIPFLQ
jgi:polar amino acid transport system substrate-binding protein